MPISELSRDLVGYRDQPPKVNWPNGAHIALTSVLTMRKEWKCVCTMVIRFQSAAFPMSL